MHENVMLFLFISARKFSTRNLPSQSAVTIGLASGEPGPSTHLSLVKVSDVLGTVYFEVWESSFLSGFKCSSSPVHLLISCLLLLFLGTAVCLSPGTEREALLPCAMNTAAFVAKHEPKLHKALYLLCSVWKLSLCWGSQGSSAGCAGILDVLLLHQSPCLCDFKAPLKKIPINKLAKKEDEYEEEKPDPEELDWWSKYYESLKELYNQVISCGFWLRGKVSAAARGKCFRQHGVP